MRRWTLAACTAPWRALGAVMQFAKDAGEQERAWNGGTALRVTRLSAAAVMPAGARSRGHALPNSDGVVASCSVGWKTQPCFPGMSGAW